MLIYLSVTSIITFLSVLHFFCNSFNYVRAIQLSLKTLRIFRYHIVHRYAITKQNESYNLQAYRYVDRMSIARNHWQFNDDGRANTSWRYRGELTYFKWYPSMCPRSTFNNQSCAFWIYYSINRLLR